MKTIYFLQILIFIFLIHNLFAQEITIKGKVIDAETGEGMPLVNVVIKSTGKGTTTDFDGFYSIRLSPRVDSLHAFYYGYQSRSKAITNWVSQTLDIQLTPDASVLDEVTVTPGENPAFRILRKVVLNRNVNNKNKLAAYQYESFNRTEISIDNLSDSFRKKKMMRNIVQIFDSLKTIAGDDGNLILPVFVSESISDYYYREEGNKTKEDIKAVKITGVGFDEGSFVSQLIGSSFQEYNFYNNTLNILNKDFISPISEGWEGFYKYELMDSLSYKGKWCYKIEFRPKRKEDLAFIGTMWIADTSFALKQIDVTTGQGTNLNYIDKIKIQQELSPTTSKAWLPVKTRILLDIAEIGDQSPGLLAKFYTSNKNFVVDEPLPTKFFEEPLTIAEDAKIKESDYWDKNRHDSLSQTEKNVYKTIDSVKNMPIVKSYVDIVNIAVNGYKRVGKIDVGPYLTLYSNNNIEGHRFRMGFRTNVNFSKSWIAKAYLAYGTRDDKFKYSAGLAYIVSRRPWTIISYERKEDYEQVGVPTEYIDNSIFLAAVQWGRLRGPYFTRQNTFAFQTDIVKGITEKIIFKTKTFEPHVTFPFAFYDHIETGDTISKDRTYNTTEITLETRLAKNELFVQRDLDRISLGTKRLPVVTLRYTAGLKGVINGDFNYQKITLNVSHILRWGVLGRTYYEITAGKIFSRVPFPLLEVHLGNESYYYTNRAFNLMNFFEFISDNYATLKYRHYFEGLFFNRIPLVKKLKWRFLTAGNIAYGPVTKKNLELIPRQDIFGKQTPKFYSLADTPYIEVGYGIENIFKIFRIDAYHRLTHLNNPGAKRFGVKFSIQFIL